MYETIKQTEKVESYIRQVEDDVEFVTTTSGRHATFRSDIPTREKASEAYSQLQVRTTDRDTMFKVLAELDKDLANEFEQPTFQFKLIFEFGPSPASKIEARIIGADPQVLRIAVEVEDVLLADPGSRNVRHDWRERTKELVPLFNESMRRGTSPWHIKNWSAGLETLQMAFNIVVYCVMVLICYLSLRVYLKKSVSTLNHWTMWRFGFHRYKLTFRLRLMVSSFNGLNLLIQRRDRKRTLTCWLTTMYWVMKRQRACLLELEPKIEALDLTRRLQHQLGRRIRSFPKDAQESLFGSTATVVWLMLSSLCFCLTLGS